MDLRLKDKVALITGGSKGIGLRTARLFAEEGCHLGICARNPDALAAAADELRGKGVRVAAVQADVTVPAEAARFVEHCAAELGRVDILINNVGNDFGGRLMEATDDDWQQTFEHCTLHAVRMTRLVAPHMQRQGGGSIVNISSVSGWHVQLAGTGQYGAAKAALIFITEHLALELVHDNVRVNTVSPGSIIWDGGGWDAFRLEHPESFAGYVRDGFPMGRLGTPEEVADIIAFIASPRAHWVNGRHIVVDGLQQPTPVREFRVW
ncbi:MAG: SDR family oxidoreductase [Anaerolineae bacterium]|nr:SDR family oxidoreductase [Anaerolineae bacterium]